MALKKDRGMRRILLILILILTMPFAAAAGEFTVAVSANVQFAFDELKTVFENDTGHSVKGIIGSSGKLTSQIRNGAPFDVFMSADRGYPEVLRKEGLTYNVPEVYVHGALVLWTLNDMDLSGGVQIVTDPAVKKIASATPKTAPYGQETIHILKHYDFYEKVKTKLVYGESISQTNQFITSRAADAGFTAKSVVLAPNMKDQGRWIEVDRDAYEPIAQAAVILKFAEKNNLDAAQQFYDFIFSEKARGIFQKYGYMLP